MKIKERIKNFMIEHEKDVDWFCNGLAVAGVIALAVGEMRKPTLGNKDVAIYVAKSPTEDSGADLVIRQQGSRKPFGVIALDNQSCVELEEGIRQILEES